MKMTQRTARRIFALLLAVLSVGIYSHLLQSFLLPEETQPALLQYGSRGQEVTAPQKALQQRGYYSGNLDGIYGSGTREAVRAFQRDAGLSVDGLAGPKTLAALGLTGGSSEGSGGGAGGNRDNDLNLLARIISAEARGEPFEGQIAVGAVVMNRVKHPSFPNTIAGVIYQPGAFSALNDGQFQQPVADSAYQAAEYAMNGMDNTGGAIYYYNPAKTSNQWMLSRPVLKQIGEHVFCS